MKRIVLALVLTLGLLGSGQAFAAPQVFDSPAGKFSINVPEGWTAKAVDMGCQLSDKSGKNSLSIQHKKADGTKPKDFGQGLVKHLKAEVIKDELDENGTYTVACKVDGEQLIVVVVPSEEFLTICVMGGPDTETMGNIVSTMQEAK